MGPCGGPVAHFWARRLRPGFPWCPRPCFESAWNVGNPSLSWSLADVPPWCSGAMPRRLLSPSIAPFHLPIEVLLYRARTEPCGKMGPCVSCVVWKFLQWLVDSLRSVGLKSAGELQLSRWLQTFREGWGIPQYDRFHYIFSLRDLSRVFQGICQADPQASMAAIHLWVCLSIA